MSKKKRRRKSRKGFPFLGAAAIAGAAFLVLKGKRASSGASKTDAPSTAARRAVPSPAGPVED